MKMILIVEDNTDINNMIYDYLCKKQFECVQAFSGTEALLYLNSSDFDIIILDLMLPGINGNELIEKVKPEIKTPIIILSANLFSVYAYDVCFYFYDQPRFSLL